METRSFTRQRLLPSSHTERSIQQHIVSHFQGKHSHSKLRVDELGSASLVPCQSETAHLHTAELGKHALEERLPHTRRSISPTARSATVRATRRWTSRLRALTARRERIFVKYLQKCHNVFYFDDFQIAVRNNFLL